MSGHRPHALLDVQRKDVPSLGDPPADWARLYTDYGTPLVRIQPGLKKPAGDEWQEPKNLITDPEVAEQFWTAHPESGMGVLLEDAGLCSLDLDNVALSHVALASVGIDLAAVLSESPVAIVGNPERRKPIFRAPAGLKLTARKLKYRTAEGKLSAVFELRGGRNQDVLPPSAHSGGGCPACAVGPHPYCWDVAPWDAEIPELPEPLVALWRDWALVEPTMVAAVNGEPAVAPAVHRVGSTTRRAGWTADVAGAGIWAVAQAAGLAMDDRRKAVGCPGCGAARRSSSDGRLPATVFSEATAFRCYAGECACRGDAMNLAAACAIGRPHWETDTDAARVRQWCAERGLCQPAREEPPPPTDADAPADTRAAADLEKAADLENAAEVKKRAAVGLDHDAPTFADAYGEEQLYRDLNRQLISLATLPSWPGGPETGHGWGHRLNELLGGGVCPGYVLAVGAASAGAGKSAWVMQVADGLALRTAELLGKNAPGTLTPVMVLSELSTAALTWRTLARWTGFDARAFRAGASAAELLRWTHERVAEAANAGLHALRGELGQARRYMRNLRATGRGQTLIDTLAASVDSWRKQLADEHQRDVWPVVVLDPIQRWQDPGKGEVEALNELVEAIGQAAADGGWVVLLTSDTNKAAATGQDSQKTDADRGRGVFRGSYKLQHLPDAAIYVDRTESAGQDPAEGADSTKPPTLDAVVVKNRWGSHMPNPNAKASYRWDVTLARFEPTDKPERQKVEQTGRNATRGKKP